MECNDITESLPTQEREDFNIYKHMRSIVLGENEEFQAFAREVFERPERRQARCSLAPVVRRFVEEYYEHRCNSRSSQYEGADI